MVEQLPSKQSVAGSIPAVGTNTEHMSKKETLEQLCNKVADIKYELQQVLDTLYKLEGEQEE